MSEVLDKGLNMSTAADGPAAHSNLALNASPPPNSNPPVRAVAGEPLGISTVHRYASGDLLSDTGIAQTSTLPLASGYASGMVDLLGDEVSPLPPTSGASAVVQLDDSLLGAPGGGGQLHPAGYVASPLISFGEHEGPEQRQADSEAGQPEDNTSGAQPDSPRPAPDAATEVQGIAEDEGLDGGGDSLQVNSDGESVSTVADGGSDRVTETPRRGSESAAGLDSDAGHSNHPASDGADGDDRPIDSDREVVEEEDAFGDFADFTTASHFIPGGGLGFSPAAAGTSSLPPPPAASARASGSGASSSGSPSTHRHGHHGGGYPGRPLFGGLSAGGAGAQLHAAPASIASEPGSFGDFSDFHASPPPSVAPSRTGGGRKSVASLASVGSRAGGDDDVGDYGSVVGSSVWRAPSQMATSSYAAAAGADDDFGDFTSDITSQSDFAPSTQPPSAVAVSGPGSVHPDDDFGSFASHRSNADDEEDDFGNFNAAPAAAAAGAVAGAGPAAGAAAGAASGAGPSGSGWAAAVQAQAGSSGSGAGAASSQAANSAGAGPSGSGSSPNPRDAAAAAAAANASHPYHSTQTVMPAAAGSAADTGAAAGSAEPAMLQLPSEELRAAVARALQPLLPPGSPLAVAPLLPGQGLPEEQVTAAWAQLRRHAQSALEDGEIAAYTGMPLPPLPGSTEAEARAAAAPADGPGSRGGYTPTVKFSRPLRWKGSDSERRLLTSLGLSELAAQARAAEAAEGPRPNGRSRSNRPGRRPLGRLASFGDAPPRRAYTEPAGTLTGSRREAEGVPVAAGSGGGASGRARGLDPEAGSTGSLMELGPAGAGATPRTVNGANGVAVQQGEQHSGAAAEAAAGAAQLK